jgi:hypothetical protein
MAGHDALVHAMGQLRGLAVALLRIANDIRLLGCGPRAGLGELRLPANEPGSSIMPGKINPTQCEAMAMVCTQVIGLDAAVAAAGAGGHLQMNVFKPLIGFNLLQSIRLLSDAINSFRQNLVVGLEPNRQQIQAFVERSLMLVTALTPRIGYEKASAIAQHAHEQGLTLKEAALKLGHISASDFDQLVDPDQDGNPSPITSGRPLRRRIQSSSHCSAGILQFSHGETIDCLQRLLGMAPQLLTNRFAVGNLGEKIDRSPHNADHISFIQGGVGDQIAPRCSLRPGLHKAHQLRLPPGRHHNTGPLLRAEQLPTQPG